MIDHLARSVLITIRALLITSAIVAGIIGTGRICLPTEKHSETFGPVISNQQKGK